MLILLNKEHIRIISPSKESSQRGISGVGWSVIWGELNDPPCKVPQASCRIKWPHLQNEGGDQIVSRPFLALWSCYSLTHNDYSLTHHTDNYAKHWGAKHGGLRSGLRARGLLQGLWSPEVPFSQSAEVIRHCTMLCVLTTDVKGSPLKGCFPKAFNYNLPRRLTDVIIVFTLWLNSFCMNGFLRFSFSVLCDPYKEQTCVFNFLEIVLQQAW